MAGLQISALPRLFSSTGRRVALDLLVLWILRKLWRRIRPSLIQPPLIRTPLGTPLSVVTSLPLKETSKAFEEQFSLSCPGSPKVSPISSGRALLRLKALPQVSRNSGRDSDACSETS